MQSVLLYPETHHQWIHQLDQIGRDGVVGAVMPEDYALECQKNPIKLTRVALQVANVALGSAFKELFIQKFAKENDLGLHVDIAQDRSYGSSIPELALWVNYSGSARWFLKNTGSRDLEVINDEIARVDQTTSDPNVANRYVVKPDYVHEFAQTQFTGYGMLVFPPGLQNDTSSDRRPAMHQEDTLSPRVSSTIYGDHI